MRMRRRMWAACLALALLVMMLPGLSLAATTRVARCNLRLRAKATSSSDTLATVPGGTEVQVLGTSGGWTQTTYNGHTGYVSTSYLMDLTPSGYYPLREGDENQYVAELEAQLVKLGYLSGTADAVYDSKTADAVKAFQKANGLSADGMAGGQTQKTLFGEAAKGVTTAEELAAVATPTAATTMTVASDSVLRKGARGDEVKALQERLIELGYLKTKADGVFGSATYNAVVMFQKKSNLTADGKAGKVTQTLMFSSSAKTADGVVSGGTDAASDAAAEETSVAYTMLKKGMTNSDVKKLQEKLKELGYLSASATGYFGTQTKAAVELFQKANGLSADGIAGSATQSKLFGTAAVDAKESGTTAQAKSYSTLKEGMKSSAVTTMQKKLRELGYLSANATGYYGSATKAAVKAFQKANGLSSDGIAGNATLSMMYDGVAVASNSSSAGTSTDSGKISGPSSSSVKLLHWFKEVKPSLKGGSTVQVFDPASNYSWKLKVLSPGRHLDSEPLTAADTASLNMAFGNKTTWTPKVVYVKLPSGTWTMATTHNTPHLSGNIKDNNFDGHLCVHFLRDMSEAEKNDPKYGVQNQKVLREAWKNLTGKTVN